MNRRVWSAFVASVAVLATTVSGTAFADDQPPAPVSINDMKATDAQLLAAISVLDGQVAGEQAALASAQQALDASNQAVKSNEAGMSDAQKHIDELKAVVSQRAIEEYMQPASDDVLTHLLSSDDVAEASRRSELLREVAGRDALGIADLKAAQADLNRERKEALAARKIAVDRTQTEKTKLDQLNAALNNKTQLDASLQKRIADSAAEDQASAAAAAAASAAANSGGRASRGAGGAGGAGGGDVPDNSRISAAGLEWPIHNSRQINSPFGMRWGRMHEGVDIEAPTGTPIFAAKAGKVTFAGWESGYGNYTCIDHGGGFSTCYGHQSRLQVSVGQIVSQGQEIGLAGDTGGSEGAHLHFETCTNGVPECFYGQYKNPMDYLP